MTSDGPAPLPAATNGFTFGSFQRLTKITDAVIRLWSRVLNALPTSRLRLQTAELSDESIRTGAPRALFAANGVEQARIEVHGAMTRKDYLHAHRGGGCHPGYIPAFRCDDDLRGAPWMGVPTLTLPGRSLLSRQGASILNAAGMRGWIADGEDDFVARALGWAEQVAELEPPPSRLTEGVDARFAIDGRKASFASCFQATLAQFADRTRAERNPFLDFSNRALLARQRNQFDSP